MTTKANYEIKRGDALTLIRTFEPCSFASLITDPPYASGGATKAEKSKPANEKYSKAQNPLPSFDGDAKDQRSWTRWAAEWLADARKVCKEGAPVCMFIDWRQLPAATDALQWAGWIWRGTAVWDAVAFSQSPMALGKALRATYQRLVPRRVRLPRATRDRKRGDLGSRRNTLCGALTAICR